MCLLLFFAMCAGCIYLGLELVDEPELWILRQSGRVAEVFAILLFYVFIKAGGEKTISVRKCIFLSISAILISCLALFGERNYLTIGTAYSVIGIFLFITAPVYVISFSRIMLRRIMGSRSFSTVICCMLCWILMVVVYAVAEMKCREEQTEVRTGNWMVSGFFPGKFFPACGILESVLHFICLWMALLICLRKGAAHIHRISAYSFLPAVFYIVCCCGIMIGENGRVRDILHSLMKRRTGFETDGCNGYQYFESGNSVGGLFFRQGHIWMWLISALVLAITLLLLSWKWKSPILNQCKNYLAISYFVRLLLSIFCIVGMVNDYHIEMPFTRYAMVDGLLLVMLLIKKRKSDSVSEVSSAL